MRLIPGTIVGLETVHGDVINVGHHKEGKKGAITIISIQQREDYGAYLVETLFVDDTGDYVEMMHIAIEDVKIVLVRTKQYTD